MDFDIAALTVPDLSKGTIVTAEVHSVDLTGSWLDHPRTAIRVPQILIPGDIHEAKILVTESEEGYAEGDVALAFNLRAKEEIEELISSREGVIVSNIELQSRKDGAIAGIIGNLPGGFLCFIPSTALNENPEDLVGGSVEVLITSLGTNALGSQKALRIAEDASEAGLSVVTTRPEDLEVGDLVTGVIDRPEGKGMVVQLDSGYSGFIPIGLASTKLIRSAEEVFEVGQRIEALVADISKGRSRWRIILDVATLSWQEFAIRAFPGTLLEGTVVSELQCKDGTGRLVTIDSPPSDGNITGAVFPDDLAGQTPAVGDKLTVKTVRVSSAHRRASFSLWTKNS